MRTLLINCKRGWGLVNSCPASVSQSSWVAITSILQKLADYSGACLPYAKLFVLGSAKSSYADDGTHNTIILAEMVSRNSRCFPVFKIIPGADGWLMRIGEGKGVLSSTANLEAFAEGQVWRTLANDARLPSAMAEGGDDQVKELPISGEKPWRAANPRKKCRVWVNESLTGDIMLDAELRQDPTTYLDLVPITERMVESV